MPLADATRLDRGGSAPEWEQIKERGARETERTLAVDVPTRTRHALRPSRLPRAKDLSPRAGLAVHHAQRLHSRG